MIHFGADLGIWKGQEEVLDKFKEGRNVILFSLFMEFGSPPWICHVLVQQSFADLMEA